MDSTGKLLSLTNHRSFSERLLARVDHVVCAKIDGNRLFLCVKTRGKVSEEVLLTLHCSASGPDRTYAPLHTGIEVAVSLDENHAMIATAPLDPPIDFQGDLPCSTAVLLEIGQTMKIFNLPLAISAAKPQP